MINIKVGKLIDFYAEVEIDNERVQNSGMREVWLGALEKAEALKLLDRLRDEINKYHPFKCQICDEGFTDPWKHALKESPIGLIAKDDLHKAALDNFRQHGYKGNCPICGCDVKTFSANGENWTTECIGCNYLYDED